jgi:hypothetical protein
MRQKAKKWEKGWGSKANKAGNVAEMMVTKVLEPVRLGQAIFQKKGGPRQRWDSR